MSEIADAAEVFQGDIDRRDRLVVGVNEEESEEDLSIPVMTVDAASERRHLDRLDRVRRERDGAAVESALQRLRLAASGSENLMPPILDAVRAYATLGEMMRVLKGVWGEQPPSSYA